MTKKFRTFAGASVVGQSHIKSGLPNQDAFAVVKKKNAWVFAVSDGLGSKPLSQIGSQNAVKCVAEAVDLVDEFIDVSDFIRLVHILWKIRLCNADISKYACTCLFSVFFKNGRLIGGLLGDGVVFAEIDGKEEVMSGNTKEFANITVSMDRCTLDDWQYFDKTVEKELSLLLATDGVADDIETEKIRGFYYSLLRNKVLLKGVQRKKNKCIKWILEHWTRPYSYDDKTLVIFKGTL